MPYYNHIEFLMLNIDNIQKTVILQCSPQAKVAPLQKTDFHCVSGFRFDQHEYSEGCTIHRSRTDVRCYTVVAFDQAIQLTGSHPLTFKKLTRLLGAAEYDLNVSDTYFKQTICKKAGYRHYQHYEEEFNKFDNLMGQMGDYADWQERGFCIRDDEIDLISSWRINTGGLGSKIAGFVICEMTFPR